MVEPNGAHISYQQYRRSTSPGGGTLDLDANGADGMRADPAENIYYETCAQMREGLYHLYVHQFSRRGSDNPGFQAEIDFLGTVYSFTYEKALPDRQCVTVAKFNYSKARGIEIVESLPSSQTVRTLWNIPTGSFHHVSALMLSPNYWDDNAVGNKHYFFMLDGCKNDGSARGFYNEFLRSDLDQHRKVLEVVGSKMKASGPDQLSGLGFSSTQKNTLICRVKGSFSRTLKVQF
jgi:hypothetical protein